MFKAWRAVPDLSDDDLAQAYAVLRDRLHPAQIDPRPLTAHAAAAAFDLAVTDWLLRQRVHRRSNPALTQILTVVLRKGFAACRTEPEFRAATLRNRRLAALLQSVPTP